MPEAAVAETTETREVGEPMRGPIPPEQAAELDKVLAGALGEMEEEEKAVESRESKVESQPAKPSTIDVRPSTSPPEEVIPEAVLNPEAAKTAEGEIELSPEAKAAIAEAKTEASKGNIRKLATSYEESKRTISRLETQLKQAQEAAPTEAGAQARIQELETRLAEIMPAFERINLEAHPDFQRQFTKPIEQAVQYGNSLLKDAGMDEGVFERVMALSGKNRVEAMDELVSGIESPSLKGDIINLASQVAQLQRQKESALRDVKGNAQRMEEHRRAEEFRMQQEQTKQLGSLFDNVLEHLREKGGFEMLKKSDAPGTEKWNESVEKTIEAARDLILNNTDMTQAVAAAILAAQTPRYRAWAMSERTRRLEVEKELAAIKGAEPGLERGGKDTPPAGEVDFNQDIGQAMIGILEGRKG